MDAVQWDKLTKLLERHSPGKPLSEAYLKDLAAVLKAYVTEIDILRKSMNVRMVLPRVLQIVCVIVCIVFVGSVSLYAFRAGPRAFFREFNGFGYAVCTLTIVITVIIVTIRYFGSMADVRASSCGELDDMVGELRECAAHVNAAIQESSKIDDARKCVESRLKDHVDRVRRIQVRDIMHHQHHVRKICAMVIKTPELYVPMSKMHTAAYASLKSSIKVLVQQTTSGSPTTDDDAWVKDLSTTLTTALSVQEMRVLLKRMISNGEITHKDKAEAFADRYTRNFEKIDAALYHTKLLNADFTHKRQGHDYERMSVDHFIKHMSVMSDPNVKQLHAEADKLNAFLTRRSDEELAAALGFNVRRSVVIHETLYTLVIVGIFASGAAVMQYLINSAPYTPEFAPTEEPNREPDAWDRLAQRIGQKVQGAVGKKISPAAKEYLAPIKTRIGAPLLAEATQTGKSLTAMLTDINAAHTLRSLIVISVWLTLSIAAFDLIDRRQRTLTYTRAIFSTNTQEFKQTVQRIALLLAAKKEKKYDSLVKCESAGCSSNPWGFTSAEAVTDEDFYKLLYQDINKLIDHSQKCSYMTMQQHNVKFQMGRMVMYLALAGIVFGVLLVSSVRAYALKKEPPKTDDDSPEGMLRGGHGLLRDIIKGNRRSPESQIHNTLAEAAEHLTILLELYKGMDAKTMTSDGGSDGGSTGAAASPNGAAASPNGAAATATGAAASPTGAAASATGAAASPTGAAASPTGAAASPTGAAARGTGAAARGNGRATRGNDRLAETIRALTQIAQAQQATARRRRGGRTTS